MYEIMFGAASNKADWAPEAIQLIDDDAGEAIDLAGASLTITVRDQNGSIVLTGTLDDYVELIEEDDVSTKLQWAFPATSMGALCAGSYRVGLIAERDGETVQIVIGTLPVVDGVVA